MLPTANVTYSMATTLDSSLVLTMPPILPLQDFTLWSCPAYLLLITPRCPTPTLLLWLLTVSLHTKPPTEPPKLTPTVLLSPQLILLMVETNNSDGPITPLLHSRDTSMQTVEQPSFLLLEPPLSVDPSQSPSVEVILPYSLLFLPTLPPKLVNLLSVSYSLLPHLPLTVNTSCKLLNLKTLVTLLILQLEI